MNCNQSTEQASFNSMKKIHSFDKKYSIELDGDYYKLSYVNLEKEDLCKFLDNDFQDLKEAFDLFDKNGDGFINKTEISAILNSLSQYPTENELDTIIAELDQNYDNKISFEEFVQLVYKMTSDSKSTHEQEDEKLKEALKKAGVSFRTIDTDDSVKILLTMDNHITPVFDLEMLKYVLRPLYDYQNASSISHSRKHLLVEVKAKKSEHNTHYRHVAKIVNHFDKLMDKLLKQREKCTILYATETGKSESFAKSLTEIFKHSFNAQCLNIKDYVISNLKNEKLLFIITSTFGNGDPPENYEEFKNRIFEMKQNKDNSLRGGNKLRFSVFGLGNSSYPKYCEHAKFLDSCLNELGAERIYSIGFGDELCAQEESFRKWSTQVYKKTLEEFQIKADLTFIESFWNDFSYKSESIRLKIIQDKQPNLCDCLSKLLNRNVRPTKLINKSNLQPKHTGRNTLNLSLDTQGDKNLLNYQPGDHIGIFAPNNKNLVEAVLSRIQNAPHENELFQIEILKEINTVFGVVKQWIIDDRFPICTLRFALTHLLDLTTPVSQLMLLHFSTQTTNETERDQLKKLARDHLAYEEWKQSYPNLKELFDEFPSLKPDANLLVTQLPKMHARVYSISSCQNNFKDCIDLTVGVVEFKRKSRSDHYGVCSKWLENLPLGSIVPAFVRGAPSFHLPDDRTLPIIMISAGTGIAPFRGFWQQLKLERKKFVGKKPIGKNQDWGEVVIYFGCRQNNVDDLYRQEIEELMQQKIITNYHIAYSRDPYFKKNYVQDLLSKNTKSICDLLLDKKGHVYICGDVKMAEEVTNVIEKSFVIGRNITHQQAKQYINDMKENLRFHEDIFGNSQGNKNQCS